jgi:uncharacterized protein (TIGR02172 family)
MGQANHNDVQARQKGPLVGNGRTAEVFAWGEDQILKLYRPEMPRDWVGYEAKIGRLVSEAGLAAPAVVDVVEVEGRLGIVYERIVGPSMLDALARRPWMLFRSARRFAEVHAAMHACRRAELPPQRDGFTRAIQHAPGLPAAARDRALAALARLPDGDALCHGDYHPDNLIMSPRGPIVIDWTNACRGNPSADVARTVLMFRMAGLPPHMPAGQRLLVQFLRARFLAAYLRAYRGRRPCPDAELEAWLPVLAAARLNERIAPEEASLLRLVEFRLM